MALSRSSSSWIARKSLQPTAWLSKNRLVATETVSCPRAVVTVSSFPPVVSIRTLPRSIATFLFIPQYPHPPLDRWIVESDRIKVCAGSSSSDQGRAEELAIEFLLPVDGRNWRRKRTYHRINMKMIPSVISLMIIFFFAIASGNLLRWSSLLLSSFCQRVEEQYHLQIVSPNDGFDSLVNRDSLAGKKRSVLG